MLTAKAELEKIRSKLSIGMAGPRVTDLSQPNTYFEGCNLDILNLAREESNIPIQLTELYNSTDYQTVSFYGLEANGDALPLEDRKAQIECISSTAGWIRELIREGVEPNPGPTFLDIKKAVTEAFTAAFEPTIAEFFNWLSSNLEEGEDSNHKEILEWLQGVGQDTWISYQQQHKANTRVQKVIDRFMEELDKFASTLSSSSTALPRWTRNLVAEGIEPNPGPQQYWSHIKIEIGNYDRWQGQLRQFEKKLAAATSVDVSEVDNILLQDILQYTEQKPQEFKLLEKAIMSACKNLQSQVADTSMIQIERATAAMSLVESLTSRRLQCLKTISKHLSAPSSFSKEDWASWQMNKQQLNGLRPAGNYELPVVLYSPILGKLSDKLRGLDSNHMPNHEDVEAAKKLMQTMSNYYASEDSMLEEFWSWLGSQ
eukprot:TRINITY_DN200_c0_g1_i1.p1 TRINITY_DN200_c0_g1~~TRINITY_DN200_c0_g1_i1.p1  ORF type:complete len:429 (+),score=67.25 TRINITY_DN200_c0_g1_i1:168-1454(+)